MNYKRHVTFVVVHFLRMILKYVNIVIYPEFFEEQLIKVAI
ncbi:hypothetical protein TKK_0011583 [Trichogramma kaykai]